MEKYTLYCSEQQTKRALTLGAPIKTRSYKFEDHSKDFFAEGGKGYFIPTAEEMVGWLEEQGLNFEGSSYYMSVEIRNGERIGIYSGTRKEATLAAIDTALDYLTNKKNGL